MTVVVEYAYTVDVYVSVVVEGGAAPTNGGLEVAVIDAVGHAGAGYLAEQYVLIGG